MNTFWIDRRVADDDEGYPACEARYVTKEEYVLMLETECEFRGGMVKALLPYQNRAVVAEQNNIRLRALLREARKLGFVGLNQEIDAALGEKRDAD